MTTSRLGRPETQSKAIQGAYTRGYHERMLGYGLADNPYRSKHGQPQRTGFWQAWRRGWRDAHDGYPFEPFLPMAARDRLIKLADAEAACESIQVGGLLVREGLYKAPTSDTVHVGVDIAQEADRSVLMLSDGGKVIPVEYVAQGVVCECGETLPIERAVFCGEGMEKKLSRIVFVRKHRCIE